MLVGRDRERRELESALECARAGESATLALVGEPGIGKTALLDFAAGRATGMRVLRARGIESEAEIPFASLLELVRPALGLLERIPPPQAIALEGALALRPSQARERFAVGAATLSLLAAYAEDCPVAVLVDDAQWLDQVSAEALLFAVRRLVADPIAVLIAVREGEPSLIDGAGLRTVRVVGLSAGETAALLPEIGPDSVRRLHEATAGNPLALLESGRDPGEFALAPDGAPLLVSARIAQAFLRRTGRFSEPERRALLLAATSESGDLVLLELAAARVGIELDQLRAAEREGLVSLRAGSVEFRHPLARSAIYAHASAEDRRLAHRALATALPDRDVDRRAWHLAAAAAGTDPVAAAALEQAGARARERSAYASAAAAFERAARLMPEIEPRSRLLLEAAEASLHAGDTERAMTLLDEARAATEDPATLLDVDELAGHVATQRGPVMRGHAILTDAAGRATGERAVGMLAEATIACFYAGKPAEMLAVAKRAWASLPDAASTRTRFLATSAFGMAHVVGGDAAAGADAIQQAIALADRAPELRDDVRLLQWLVVAPIFLREAETGRELLERALDAARAHAALGALPFVLALIARDQATTDRLAVAEATYREAITLARESDQRTGLVQGLAGLAWLQGRRGRELECRAAAAEAMTLCDALGTRLLEVWAVAAVAELELALGATDEATAQFERQRGLLEELGITDPDLSPAPELVDAHIRAGRPEEAQRLTEEFDRAARAKGQPWSLARALRCRGQVGGDELFATEFEQALEQHARTPDAFEEARTRLAYGERLRRARSRVRAREQLRAAVAAFEQLEAHGWMERARAELEATGETLLRRDPTTLDVLTPQELQIALLLARGRTTREAATALFLSPKTVEYHLHHVYQKLDIHSREELASALANEPARPEPAPARA